MANGSFSLLSEAVYLRKPICSVPIAGQFEQFVNAAYVEKMGYGRHFASFTADGLKTFLYELSRLRERLQGYTQEGNAALFAAVDRQLVAVQQA